MLTETRVSKSPGVPVNVGGICQRRWLRGAGLEESIPQERENYNKTASEKVLQRKDEDSKSKGGEILRRMGREMSPTLADDPPRAIPV